MENETVKATGKVHIQLFDKEGRLKEERLGPNVVVTVGKNFLAAWLVASSQALPFMNYVAIGTGTTGAVAGDTALQTEIARKSGGLSSSTNVWQNSAPFNAGEGTGAITEAGLFSASSGGTMLARQTFGAVNKGAGDVLLVTWQITFS
jgi:hypothetical protein